MTNPIDRLAKARELAEGKEQTKRDFSKFIARAKESGYWTEEDIAKYIADIKVLMGGTDEEVMALYAPGVFESAEAARQGAKIFWRNECL